MAVRTLHINAFLYGAGHHSSAWRHPDSAAERIGDIAYFEELTRTAERGRLDAVFFADGHSVNPAYTAGTTWFLEPITALSAMARATEKIGLVTTVSASFYTPFHAARMLASLDHISGGRAGANIVTSMFDAEARNHGSDSLPAHTERYGRAEEFIDAIVALWDSWDEHAVIADRSAGRFLDADAIHRIEHRGKHFRVDGPLTVPRCPQGRPVLFQAGASDTGRDLAARHAEAVYSVAWDLPAALEFATDLRAAPPPRDVMPRRSRSSPDSSPTSAAPSMKRRRRSRNWTRTSISRAHSPNSGPSPARTTPATTSTLRSRTCRPSRSSPARRDGTQQCNESSRRNDPLCENCSDFSLPAAVTPP